MRINIGKKGWVWRIVGVGVLLVLMQAPISNAPFLHPFYDSVNAVVGDESYLKAFGEWPDQTVSEQVRIQTHLAYVEDVLRKQRVDHLTPDKRKQRLALLDHLRVYWEDGKFPQRVDTYPKRRPCFIDDAGNICAVGYLLEQTAGRDLAEKINAEYQYAYLWDMHDDKLSEWVDASGFSLKELAMVQPMYPGDWWGRATLYIMLPNGNTPCKVDFEDFIAFALAFNSSSGDSNYNQRADTNVDGVVNFPDFIAFAGVFGLEDSCYKVSGMVGANGVGLDNVSLGLVELDGRNTVTDSLGAYTFEHVPRGDFRMVPEKVGYVFSPDTLLVSVVDSNLVAQNFEAIPIQPLLVDRANIRD